MINEEMVSPRVVGLGQAEVWAGRKMSGKEMRSLHNLELELVSEADLSRDNFEILSIVESRG